MKKTDLAYVAGIFDGEGCVCLRINKGRYYSLDISVANTNEWLMQWLKFAFGGNFYAMQAKTRKAQNWKPCWRWTITGNKGSSFLKLILPYLRLKKPQAELAIKFQEARRGAGYLLTDEERALEEAQRVIMGKYNKRGTINKGRHAKEARETT